jgi:5-formyltetrahydrofolate cyclo-ligase
MTDTKTEWRSVLLRARQALDAPLRRAHSAAVVEHVASLPEFATSRAVGVYLPLGAEVDPLGIAVLAAKDGKAVYHPLSGGGALGWTRHVPPVTAGDAGKPSSVRAMRIPEAPLLLIIPGVGFDHCGTRLGRGWGFYDRAIARLRQQSTVFAVGVAFEVQVVAQLPQDPWDQPVDLVATERRLIIPEREGDSHHSQEVHES